MSILHNNAVGNLGFLKKRFSANAAAGEKLVGSEFYVEIEGFPGLSILIRNAQLPELTREDVEDFAPSGVKTVQHGTFRNSGEWQMQCAETIKGDVLLALKSIVLGKQYVNMNFYISPESLGGNGDPIRKMEYCKLSLDAVDFATEDVTQIVRPSIRVVYNWQE